MRRKFLLDFNIIYHAARGVDRRDDPDESAERLLDFIARICHSVTIHISFLGKYSSLIEKLRAERPRHLEPINSIKQLLFNIDKRNLEYGDLPKLPAGVKVPTEDEDLVRAALISHPVLVTEDGA